MPNGDRTGPQGQGSMTGRGMGMCAGLPNRRLYGQEGSYGRGCGMGFGGRGRRNRFRPLGWGGAGRAGTGSLVDRELAELRQQAASLHSTLETISGRIEQLEKNRPE